ncbi:P-loop containing nucleoside triphosphate hydrolase protein [Aspergillus pseudonomiae]|nr:P-loop containing nucleoside triphosphate hydrolase protein [Aspergillus pseudonomiae]
MENVRLLSTGTGFLIVLILHVYAFRHILSWATRRITTRYRSLVQVYEDQDGEATQQTIEHTAKWGLRLAILVIATAGMAIVGLRMGLAMPHIQYPANVAYWMEFGVWICVLIQSIALTVPSSSTEHFAVSWRMGASSLVALLICLVQIYANSHSGHIGNVYIALAGAQIAIGVTIVLLSSLIPRRPDVFYKGIMVDRQFTTSLLGWVSFSWIDPVLRKSEHSQRLAISDLPELDNSTRGVTVYRVWKGMAAKYNLSASWGLWCSIFRSHGRALLYQMALTLLLSFLSFGPQIALWHILKLLEARESGKNADMLWVPVIGLGLSVLGSATLDTLKFWISFNNLNLRVQQQLSLAIFNKAVRLHRATSSDEADNDETTPNPVNMAAVDARNIADFFCFFFIIYESPTKLAIASVFLTRLLGWRSLLAGVTIWGLLTLFNAWAVSRYSTTQAASMQHRDNRLRAVVEMLRGVRQIKFSALESRWEGRIRQLRGSEIRAQWAVCLWQMAFMSMYFISPILLSATCLSVYIFYHGSLDASTAFTALAVMSSLEIAMGMLPNFISFFLSAKVSIRRVTTYLSQPERFNKVTPAERVEFRGATVAWPGCSDTASTLTGLTLAFPEDSLSIITGPTGSGKSLLLAAILGEAEILNGSISAPVPVSFEQIAHVRAADPWVANSAVAFVSQSMWLQTSTLRENILLGLPLDKERYAKVIFACALEKDLELLPQKDQTEISANGTNLSGGQRWRICLARALYSRARTLLLDDIFSALDVHTCEHISQYALGGELLQGRTCILVTHHLKLCLPRAKYLVQLENGGLKSADILPEPQPAPQQPLIPSIQPKEEALPALLESAYPDRGSLESINISSSSATAEKASRLATNSSERTVASTFLTEGGNIFQWLFLAVSFMGFSGLMLAKSWWIHIWTDDFQASAPVPGQATEQIASQHSVLYYLGVYIILSLLACAFGTGRIYSTSSVALRASQNLFHKVLSSVLRAPLQWHDNTPLGHVLSRFSADFNALDAQVGTELCSTFEYAMDVAAALIAGTIANPALLIITIVLLTMYFWFARRYIKASRQLKDLENDAKGPLLEELESTISGLSSVRAFGQVDVAVQRFQDKVGLHARAFWHLWLLNRWLAFRVNVLGAAFSALSAVMVAYMPGISPSVAGFAIGFTLQISFNMAMGIRAYSNLEQAMNSVKRIHSLTTIQTESDKGHDQDLPRGWPREGKLEVSQLFVQHAAHLPPVLKGLHFTVSPNSRVGVIGRTGAGKSSLVLALFRFLEASHGSIMVDNVDISQVSLSRLRSQLAIIPQHPVLFRGTVRSNLDPFGEYDDAALAGALQAVGWYQDRDSEASPGSPLRSSSDRDSLVEEGVDTEHDYLIMEKGTENPLDQPVADCGENLSQGQQQLLCLARAIIRRPKILVMDEATSSVDSSTDDLIQRSLRSALGQYQTTFLVIAHRLKTIADSDMVLVMDDGMIVESGSPKELLLREQSSFRGMVYQDPEREMLEDIILNGIQ